MKLGETVRVTATDENLKEREKRMLIDQKHIDARRTGITGVVIRWISVYDGTLCYIRQSDGVVGAYLANELEVV